MDEADLAIDADRSFVGGKRGKKRDAAVRVDGTGDGGDECLRVAVAAKFRVGADGAHFCETGRGEAPAGHGGEASIDTNTEKASECGGPIAKRARLGEGG